MTFTKELPTVPGFYAWRKMETSKPIGAVVIDNGKSLEVEFSDASCGRVGRTGGEWCRLVPAEEIQKAWDEAMEAGDDIEHGELKHDEAWPNSCAKRVMEGKE